MNLLLSIFVGIAYAFIPPVTVLTKDAVEGRRTQPYTEIIFRHHIEIRPGEGMVLEEQWIGDAQRLSLLFKSNDGSALSAANFEKKTYSFPSGLKISSQSSAFVKYLLTASADDLLATLVSERFVRREHLNQFKPGFEPKGDPQNWEVKEYYIPQEGVSLRRVKSQPTFAFSGSSEEPGQTVFYGKESNGLRRLEWRRGTDSMGWNFDGHSRFQSPGSHPKLMEFERNGQTLIRTELLVHRPAKEKQFVELKKLFRSLPPPSGQYEEAIKMLLSYR